MTRRGFITTGVLLGDAMGYPINSIRAGHTKQLLGDITGMPDRGDLFEDRPDRYREPGLHSSVGQTFLAVLAGFEPDEAQRDPVALTGSYLLELAGEDAADHGALRFPGRPLQQAIKQWREEYPWEGADFIRSKRGSKGASPAVVGLAVVASGRTAADPILRDLVHLTHGRFLPLASAYAVARCAELLLQSDNPKRVNAGAVVEELIRDLELEESRLITSCGDIWREHGWGLPERRLSDALRPLVSLIREGDDLLAATSLLAGIGEFGPDCAVTHAAHGFAPVAVAWAFYRALGSHSPAQSLGHVVNEGGETCTIGALVGGLLAARYGAEFFPAEWVSGLKVRSVAGAASVQRPGWVSEWLAWERAASARESRRRAELVKARGVRMPASKPQRPRSEEQACSAPEPAPFAPPPPEWLTRINPEDPIEKRKLKENRGRKRIGWKEDRRRSRDQD